MKLIPRYPRNLWILALGMMINITGASFLWPLNTIYMTQQLGQSVTTAGTILMLHAGAGIFGNLLGGFLYDRWGGKWTILLGIVLGTSCAFSLALFQDLYMYVLLMILLGFSNGIVFPAIYAMAGGVWPEGGRKAFNVIYVCQNVGVALGSALGGLVAQVSFTIVFVANGLSFLLFLVIVWFGVSDRIAIQPRGGTLQQEPSDLSKTEQDIGSPSVKPTLQQIVSLAIISFGFMACWITYVQWQTSISVYMQGLGFSLASYSLLWTINGALILLAQPFTAYVTERFLPSVKAQLLTGVLFFLIALAVLSQTQMYSGFMIAMIVMTIGEIFIWPAVPTAAQELAPKGKTGFYQGVVGSAATAGRMLGPFIGGLLFELYNAQIMFYGMLIICALACMCYLVFDWGIKKQKLQDERVIEKV